jgi:hypothetical protein
MIMKVLPRNPSGLVEVEDLHEALDYFIIEPDPGVRGGKLLSGDFILA